uniref:Uncharacterized protein n=1 Tax=Rhizophora mucronata TaxID=61149 RepID=A0A2P2J038_RHIMU
MYWHCLTVFFGILPFSPFLFLCPYRKEELFANLKHNTNKMTERTEPRTYRCFIPRLLFERKDVMRICLCFDLNL